MVSYRDLPGDSTVWIYQSTREILSEEVKGINEKASDFLLNWAAHGTVLKAAIELFYDYFIVVFVDEKSAKASGCSIDKSFQFIKNIESGYELDLLNRMVVAYRNDLGIQLTRIDKFEQLIQDGLVTENTIVFNNLVNTKTDFDSKWEVLLKDSWHRRML